MGVSIPTTASEKNEMETITLSKKCVVCGKPVMMHKPHEYLDKAKTLARHPECSVPGPGSPNPGGTPVALEAPRREAA